MCAGLLWYGGILAGHSSCCFVSPLENVTSRNEKEEDEEEEQ
jgi:hypothetical protein